VAEPIDLGATIDHRVRIATATLQQSSTITTEVVSLTTTALV
jgi:hypothetical protein